MNLYIIRHATASQKDYFPGDIYRTLNEKGYNEAMKQAMMMASSMAARPDLIITSPAVRAYSTSLVFALNLAYETSAISINDSIYEAKYQTLLHIINAIESRYRTVMLFGHNPGLSDLVNCLCGPVTTGLPAGGIAQVEFAEGSWKEVAEGTGILRNLIM